MDVKLAEYRIRKKRENAIKGFKKSLTNGISWVVKKKSAMQEVTIQDGNRPDSPASSEVEESKLCEPITWANFILYASLWAILYSLAIYIEFGAVYFVISSLLIIYYNTRTGVKESGEMSAYSVFNPGCEAIKGTMKAEQFEQELGYGALHTHTSL